MNITIFSIEGLKKEEYFIKNLITGDLLSH
jgi:hypothetical protein